MLYCFLGGLKFVLGPIVGTFGLVIAFELLRAIQQYQALLYRVLMIVVMLRAEPGRPAPAARRRAMSLLRVENLTKRFGSLTAVNDVSFEVEEGQILSIIGPNGAGKSTLFKLIGSFLAPSAGRVLFEGAVVSGLKPHQVARKGIVAPSRRPRCSRR